MNTSLSQPVNHKMKIRCWHMMASLCQRVPTWWCWDDLITRGSWVRLSGCTPAPLVGRCGVINKLELLPSGDPFPSATSPRGWTLVYPHCYWCNKALHFPEGIGSISFFSFNNNNWSTSSTRRRRANYQREGKLLFVCREYGKVIFLVHYCRLQKLSPLQALHYSLDSRYIWKKMDWKAFWSLKFYNLV